MDEVVEFNLVRNRLGKEIFIWETPRTEAQVDEYLASVPLKARGWVTKVRRTVTPWEPVADEECSFCGDTGWNWVNAHHCEMCPEGEALQKREEQAYGSPEVQ